MAFKEIINSLILPKQTVHFPGALVTHKAIHRVISSVGLSETILLVLMKSGLGLEYIAYKSSLIKRMPRFAMNYRWHDEAYAL